MCYIFHKWELLLSVRLGIHLLQLLRMFFAALELKECTICCATYAAKIMRTAYIRFDLHV